MEAIQPLQINHQGKIVISIGTVVVVLFALFLFYNSAKLDTKQIIGVWDADDGYVIEFMENGTVRQENKEGTYVFSEDGILKLSDAYDYENAYFDVEIKGNSMELSIHGDENQTLHLKKR